MSESSNLPSGWALVPLGDLGDWIGGGTPSKANSSFWSDGSIPWVSPKDMKVPVIFDSIDHISEAAVRNSATRMIEPGSILFVTRSGILAHTLPVARTAVPVTVNQDIKALTPAPGLEPDYLAWGARAHGWTILNQCSKDGTTVASVDTSLLHDFPLPIAPELEQRRIVAAIESCFTRLDNAVATLERVQRNLKRYRASVLKAAVEGRLVPTEAELARAEGRGYEPASVLLERILAERRRRWEEGEVAKMTTKGKVPKDDKWKAKYDEPGPPDTSELPDLPEGWCWVYFGSVVTVRGGYAFKSDDYLEGQAGVPLIRQSELRTGIVDVAAAKHLPPDYLEEFGDFYGVQNGDILVGLSGSLSSVSVYQNERAALQNQRTGLLRVSPLVSRAYVLCTYLSVVPDIMKAGKGVAVQNVSPKQIEAIVVPLPPLAEQLGIVAEVERHTSVIGHAEQTLDEIVRRADRLRQSILKWAFEGRLVDQDPTDEPTSALLERIRGERESVAPGAGRNRSRRSRSRTGT